MIVRSGEGSTGFVEPVAAKKLEGFNTLSSARKAASRILGGDSASGCAAEDSRATRIGPCGATKWHTLALATASLAAILRTTAENLADDDKI